VPLEITRWTVPDNPRLRFYSGLPWTGFAIRAMSFNHDGLDDTGHGYETVTTAPDDAGQLACVKALNGNHNARHYAPVITWPGCLQFTQDIGPRSNWEEFEREFAHLLNQEYGQTVTFVDSQGLYKPERPMVVLAGFPDAMPETRPIHINWPLITTGYGYRTSHDNRLHYPGDYAGAEPDPQLLAVLKALDSVPELNNDGVFVHPNSLTLRTHRDRGGLWPDLIHPVLQALAPVTGWDATRFQVHEITPPFIDGGP
jgi:hypothetical protein